MIAMLTLSPGKVHKAIEQFFLTRKPFVLFGTGTSCAVDTSFGMEALKNHLLNDISPDQLEPEGRQAWSRIIKLLEQELDLESALNVLNGTSNEGLIKTIVESTAKLMIELDKKYGRKVQMGELNWPAIAIFERLHNGLQGSNPVLHVATTNYDLLAEYAFENKGIPYSTGYYGNICRRFDWDKATRAWARTISRQIARKLELIPRQDKHIRFYKVHGSLNHFKWRSKAVESNAWIYSKPTSVERLMITPGEAKYEKLHDHRKELLTSFDQAVERHYAFLFLGFGFNDNQLINPAIKRKLIEQQVHSLIITMESNDRIDKLLKESKNLWLVCKIPEKGNEGTRISNVQYSNFLDIQDKSLWKIDEFAKNFLGG